MSAPWTFAGLYGPNTLLDQNSKEAANLSINVFLTGTTTFANLYTDQTKATGRSNPILSDAFGNFSFFADPGLYDLSYTMQGVPNKFTVSVSPFPGTSPYPNINALMVNNGLTSANSGFYTGIQVSGVVYDAGNNTSGGVYNAPLQGLYSFTNVQACAVNDTTANAAFTAAVGSKIGSATSFTLYAEGTTAMKQAIIPSSNNAFPTSICRGTIILNPGDAIQGWYGQSGNATNLVGFVYCNYFEVTYLGPT